MTVTKLKTVGDCVKLCESAGIKISPLDENLFETAGVIDGLLSEIAEFKGSVIVLETMLKPDGYNDDDGQYYDCPHEYVDGLLTPESKVGDKFSLIPFARLPEATFVVTSLDENSFEIEQLQEQE